MTSQAIRDPAADHLLTPKNSVLIVIDYQPVQVRSIASMDRHLLVDNIVRVEFLAAVKATGRKKLIMAALWTEACLTFPTLDALRDGYEVYPVVDAVGGTSVEAHRAALDRVVQAGAKPVSWVQLVCELQRDWNRRATVAPFKEILFGWQA
jgi:nicotinamidase-related amidase